MRNGDEIISFVIEKLGLKNDAELARRLNTKDSTINTWRNKEAGKMNLNSAIRLAQLCQISVSELIGDVSSKVVGEESSVYKTPDPYEMWMAHLLHRWNTASAELRESIEGGLKSTFGECKANEIIHWLGKKCVQGGVREKKKGCQ